MKCEREDKAFRKELSRVLSQGQEHLNRTYNVLIPEDKNGKLILFLKLRNSVYLKDTQH